jgi:hypothetical protein
MYGPLVFRNYNGWNTGISIVNIAEQTNDVDITFFGSGGGASVFQDSLTISPKGQNIVYIPHDPALVGNDTFVGSVVLSSNCPFHASIDQVKYGSGEAMSYIATAAGAQIINEYNAMGYKPSLSLPLVQKGSQITGLGDTTGIQLFNADPDHYVRVQIEFFNQSGNSSQPTSNQPLEMTLLPHQNTTLYTMNFSGMLQNFTGSAVVTPIEGYGNVVGVSNNINYDVASDGAAAYNMVNALGQFRFHQSQTQLFLDDIVLEESGEAVAGDTYTVTATALDQFGQPLPNVPVEFSFSNEGNPTAVGDSSGTTAVNGQVDFTFTNDTPGVTNTVTATANGGPSDWVTVDWVAGDLELELEILDKMQPYIFTTEDNSDRFLHLRATVSNQFIVLEGIDVTFNITGDVIGDGDPTNPATFSDGFGPDNTFTAPTAEYPYDDVTDADGRAEPYFRRAGFGTPDAGTLTLHATAEIEHVSVDIDTVTASDSIIVQWEDDPPAP